MSSRRMSLLPQATLHSDSEQSHLSGVIILASNKPKMIPASPVSLIPVTQTLSVSKTPVMHALPVPYTQVTYHSEILTVRQSLDNS
jgi:hypothetical protein